MAAGVAAVVPSEPPVDWQQLARLQATCADLQRLRAGQSSLQLQLVEIQGHAVWCDVSGDMVRPVLPVAHRKQAFLRVHGLAHAGTRATTRLLSQRFIWPGLAKDARDWCAECVPCHRAKAPKMPNPGVEQIPIPSARFSHVHLDLVGPLPPAPDGRRFFLTMLDRSTRWAEVVPLADTSADTVLSAFLAEWVARYGVPAEITTDRGVQFTAGSWSQWCAAVGIHHILTTAYHPQSNGLVERFHRQLKDSLRARAGPWWEELPWVLLGLRAAPKEEAGVSAAEAALGAKLALPGQFPAIGAGRSQPSHGVLPPTTKPLPPQVSALDQAEWVYIRRGGVAGGALSQRYTGPFRVMKRHSKFFTVECGDRVENIALQRLRPHRGSPPAKAASAPRRGRPRKSESAQAD